MFSVVGTLVNSIVAILVSEMNYSVVYTYKYSRLYTLVRSGDSLSSNSELERVTKLIKETLSFSISVQAMLLEYLAIERTCTFSDFSMSSFLTAPVSYFPLDLVRTKLERY